MTARKLAVALGIFAIANAHAVMDTPKPYGFGNVFLNGPMAESGFPCKKDEVSFTDRSSNSTWSGGSTQLLHLTTAATHGGGTCFIAMTYESPASPAFENPSNWRNVYIIPGDCPATTAGNLDTVKTTTSDGYAAGQQCVSSNSNQIDCVHSYQLPMPDELMNGPATFAWIWLSHLTTETYMNCAPITISGAMNNGKFNSLPNLEGLSFTGLSGGGPPGGSNNTPSSASPSTTVAIPTTLTKAYVNSVAVSEVSNAVVTNPSGSSSSSICKDGTVPCSSSGFFCINETTFGECMFGCAVPMQMSAGTACLGDAIAFATPGKARRRAARRDEMTTSCNTS